MSHESYSLIIKLYNKFWQNKYQGFCLKRSLSVKVGRKNNESE